MVGGIWGELGRKLGGNWEEIGRNFGGISEDSGIRWEDKRGSRKVLRRNLERISEEFGRNLRGIWGLVGGIWEEVGKNSGGNWEDFGKKWEEIVNLGRF